ncbi:hypothetical protein [Photobacterium damselae]|uniref:hypothetical protein n=1 Tax=Photobacterium damselae TaxID=38293 RepID=UPI001F246AA5|nr:hypothetical protein [Photobacterium damselae]UKA12908.1 hypothetical protein IHC91_21560 [Photobacterium damselae subsp. damselae]
MAKLTKEQREEIDAKMKERMFGEISKEAEKALDMACMGNVAIMEILHHEEKACCDAHAVLAAALKVQVNTNKAILAFLQMNGVITDETKTKDYIEILTDINSKSIGAVLGVNTQAHVINLSEQNKNETVH